MKRDVHQWVDRLILDTHSASPCTFYWWCTVDSGSSRHARALRNSEGLSAHRELPCDIICHPLSLEALWLKAC